jgi:1-deoxy-D-xylulose-5-phosphate reductoisomerase
MTERVLGVAILGSTGSVGRQALDVIRSLPGRFRVVGLAGGSNHTLLEDQAREFHPDLIWCQASERHMDLKAAAGRKARWAPMDEMAAHYAVDIVLVATSGTAGLAPTLAALGARKAVALANKEVLVMAGGIVTRAAAKSRAELRPVDSEHSAIWQCLWGEERASVRRLIITASGGPFWAQPELDLDQVTVEQALNHPRWSMGPKVTIDSATLMNKGLELIEAHHLFGIPLDAISVSIHPQSVVHSLVEFVDGSLKAQLGRPDMRLPIAVALAYPDRLPDAVPPTTLSELSGLEFHDLDEKRFPAVRLAREAARTGRGHPAVLNAANEEAVKAFLAREIPFGSIVNTVARALEAFPGCGDSLDDILGADRWTRDWIAESSGSLRRT